MKMTRLEWRYLQRIALDHPYYDTHKPPLSDAEAKAIMEANNTMTGREFVDSIYAKLGMIRPVKEKKRLAWLSNIGELFTVPPIRKIAIAILVVLLMTVFFAATPTGRAIAESVIQYFVTLFEDGRVAVNQSGNETMSYPVLYDGFTGEKQDPNEITAHIVYVDTFREFTETTGKKPFILPLPYTAIFYEYDDLFEYLQLCTIYETPYGKVVTYQDWNVEDLIASTSTEYKADETDTTIFYSIEENGDISLVKTFEDSVFSLSSMGSYTLDELIRMLKDNDNGG